jgi:hypothetical protein
VVASVLSVAAASNAHGQAQDRSANAPVAIPVIYCTDLFHPHEDPDDHFDLAAVFAFPQLDIRGIVLDQGGQQMRRPGRIPVSQMSVLTGRKVTVATGLEHPLRSPTDPALDQPAVCQGGVELILRSLRESATPVMIATVGSVRDVVAAFNRDADLFRAKAGKLLVFIGEATDPAFREYNVALDPQAYVGLMRSGLPIYWVPCFDGGLWQNAGHASFWQAQHEALLQRADPRLVQYFIYALEKETADPLAFLSSPVDPVRKARLLAGTRNLWCTAIFGVLADCAVAVDGADTRFVPLKSSGPARPGGNELFGFTQLDVSITDDAVIRYGATQDARQVWRFEIRHRARYAEAMTRATAELLAGLGAKAPPSGK